MKSKQVNKELVGMSIADAVVKLAQLKKELFSLRLSATTSHVKDYSLFKKLRRDVARVKTYIHTMQIKDA